MKEFGVVTRADRDKIEVKVDRRSACGDCRACGMTEQEREHVFELANTVGAGVGDTVVLEMKAKGIFKGCVHIVRSSVDCLDSRSCCRKLHFKVLKRGVESICFGSSGWASCRLCGFFGGCQIRKDCFKEQDLYADCNWL